MRVGIVGCGNIARVHAEAYRGIPEVELVAVCDELFERATAFADRYGARRAFSDVDAMLRQGDVEAVSICTPHLSHPAVVEKAAAARVHAISEKPLAVSLDDADRAIATARRAGIKLGVIHQRRFWPAATRVRRAIDEGKLGRVVLGRCIIRWSRTSAYYARTPWRGKWATEGGGVLVNQAAHAIDLFQWFMGAVNHLYGLWGNLTHPDVDVDTMATATVRFVSGALGTIEASLSPVQTDRGHTRIVLYGENGSWVSLHEEPEGAYGRTPDWEIPGEEDAARRLYAEETASGDYMYRIVAAGSEVPVYRTDCHRAQLANFMSAIQHDREPLVNGEEARRSIEIVEAMYRSARTGLVQTFPLLPKPV